MKYIIKILTALLVISLFSPAFAADEKEKDESKNGIKDVIIVLDTSLSMVGYGGENVMPQVKNILRQKIDEINFGDTLTFMTFDQDVKTFDTFQIDDENDKTIAKNFVSEIDPAGKWTYNDKMIKALADKWETLKSKNPDRVRIAIILTDAIDDPPPSSKGIRRKVQEIAKAQGEYVFIIDFAGEGNLENLIGKVKDEVSSNVTKIDPDKAEELEKIAENIKKAEDDLRNQKSKLPLVIGLIVLAILILAIIFFVLRMRKVKVRGLIKYRNLDKIRTEYDETDLGKYNLKRFVVGKIPGLDLYLMEYTENTPLIFEAVSFKGEVKVVINEKNGVQVDFRDEKKEMFLRDGDTFRASNYEFTYFEDVENK